MPGIPGIPALRRLRQEVYKFKVNQGYRVRLSLRKKREKNHYQTQFHLDFLLCYFVEVLQFYTLKLGLLTLIKELIFMKVQCLDSFLIYG
jgi:hypothetical protein